MIKDKTYKALLKDPPVNPDGSRRTIGRIPSSYWRGYDGQGLSVGAENGSMAYYAWKAGQTAASANNLNLNRSK